ncbi:hypothetical protein FWG86_01485 [Candidatus Saccharibacteria bacterium]|nr:hypothetical protein [Candidatus Saccharibacteria bacterium]
MARTIPKTGYGGIYGEEDVRNKRAGNAADDFASAEKNASGGAPKNNEQTTSSSTDVAENGAAGQGPKYSGDGAGAGKAGGKAGGVAGAAAKATPMGRFMGGMKNAFKSGDDGDRKPLFAIGGLTGIVGVIMMLVSSTLPIHMISNFGDLRNTMFGQNSERTNVLIRRMTRGEVDSNLFSKRSTMGNRRLAQMNRGLNDTGFRFEFDSGSKHYVMLRAEVDPSTGTIKRTSSGQVDFTGAQRINSEVELKAMFDGDKAFRTAWNDGTKTMTGKNSGWFNRAMAYMLRGNRLTRNLFKGFIAREDARAALRAMQGRLSNSEKIQTNGSLTDATRTVTEGTDSNGNPTTTDTTTSPQARQKRFQDLNAKITSDIRVKAMQLVTGVAAAYCGVKLAIAAVSAVYAMDAAMRGLAVVAGYFEAGQKPLAGDGDDSYHAFGEMLNTATETTIVDENGNREVLNDGVKMSPTEARGMQAILVGGLSAGDVVDDPSVAKYSMEQAMKHVSTSANEVRNCSRAMMIAGGVQIGIFAAQVIVGIFTLGIGAGLIEIGKIAAQQAGSALVMSILAGAAIKKLVPIIAMTAITAIATEVWGEDFGNLVGSFGSRYFSKGHQGNGGPATGYDNALAFYVEQQRVLAYAAELDRATKSPFDITNQNTFLGKISSNLAIASAGRSKSILGQMNTLGALTGSMRLPVNMSSAATYEIAFRDTINWSSDGNGCSRLEMIGAVGDMFCNPIRSNDLTTSVDDPEFVFYKTAASCRGSSNGSPCSFGVRATSGSTNSETGHYPGKTYTGTHPDGRTWSVTVNATIETGSDGLEKINYDSDLGKMIKYGVDRKTDPGITDANIVQEEANLTTGLNALDTVLNAIPVVGDFMQIAQGARQNLALEAGWVNGEAFCAGCEHDNDAVRAKWSTDYRYLNQYIVDTNAYENVGAIDSNPVVAFMEEYIWPFEDRSYAGILAANMGMPKEWVVATLAFAEDLRDSPSEVDDLIASAPNIYMTYYHGIDLEQLTVPEDDGPYSVLANMQQSTQTAGVEWRRRFNAEAVA